MISRRIVQGILGAVWLLDGILQLKPQMFTVQFITQVIQPTGQSEPAWITAIVNSGIHLAMNNTALWNALFAMIQIAIGIALLFNFRLKISLTASIVWSGIVWVFGEGMGQLLTGQSLLLTGAPGAAFLYGLISIAVWPRNDESQGIGDWRKRGVRFARYSLGIMWLLGCVLHFQHAYVTGKGMSDTISISWISNLVSTHAAASTMFLGGIEFGIGLLILANNRMRVMAWVSIGVSFAYWWIGQSFGQIFDPLATDPNSGALMIVLSLAACPYLIGRIDRQSLSKSDGSSKRKTESLQHQLQP